MKNARLLGILFAATAYAAAGDAVRPEPSPPALGAERFDCADAFDLVAMTVMFRCANYRAPASAVARIDAAVARLRGLEEDGTAAPHSVRIAFCPLGSGTGIVPMPGQLYLDDGLIALSTDGLAEIIAHELVHLRQFAELGPRGFKCEYVRAMFACGGCQDRRHRLEREAYAEQDRIRERLLRTAGAGAPP